MSQDLAADSNVGRMLGGQYRVEALIGQGGMGRVYRGLQLSVKRAVAIKLIHTALLRDQSEAVKRFRREAEATARLSHPNSVRLFDFGVTEAEELYIVMELLQGVDLARHLAERGPLPLQEALAIARQVLLALSEAHALGIIHRDLKPDNVFLASVPGSEPIAKVMDFGVAGIEYASSDASLRLTSTGMILGTPAYMSPEQAQGLAVGVRSDLYSFGILLFELLAGRPPFAADTTVSLLVAHVTQPPQQLKDAGVNVPRQAGVQALLDRLLAKDPEQRPASAAETLDAIEALVSGAQLEAVAASPEAAGSHEAAQPRPARHVTRFVTVSGFLLAAASVLILRQLPAARSGSPNATSAPASTLYNVTIASAPSGATVLLDGAVLGKTPYQLQFKRPLKLSLIRHGYQRRTIQVTPDSDPTLAVDLVARVKDEPRPKLEGPPAPGSDSPALERVTTAIPSVQPSAAASQLAPAVPSPPSAARETSHSAALQHEQRSGLGVFVDRLFGREAERARREAMLREPLPYANFPAAQRAFEDKRVSLEQYEDVLWVLKEQRRQRVEAERRNLWRGLISRPEYESRLDRIGAEFRGE